MQPHWALAFTLVTTATLISMACLLLIAAVQSRATPPGSIFSIAPAETVFIFDGEALVDASPPARAMINSSTESGGQWFRAVARLEPMFPGLFARLEGLQREGRFILCSREDISPPLVLRAEYIGGLTRLTLIDGDGEAARPGCDGLAELALRDELDLLRETLARAPMPVWRETSDGEVIWANGPYLALAAELLEPGKELSWPLPAVLRGSGPASADSAASDSAPATKAAQDRAQRAQSEGERRAVKMGPLTRWFQVVTRLAGRQVIAGSGGSAGIGGGRLCYALPADNMVNAERSLSDFTQTLAKTFAQLPIGLAIFNHARVLQMFNPALLDLTGLPVDFLIARPSLPALLDAMRERSMLPEPKDYRSWRRQMAEMEKAAAEGLFEDTWMLPSGQTWRVSGRPHPNGALAFMIEDISTEMTRTRRYRADLELGQAVIDGLSDAVVVFAQDGSVAMANAAASALWGEDPLRMPAGRDPSLRAVGQWRQQTAPTLLWNDLEEFIGLFGPREPWEGELRMTDGRGLACHIAPMPHGATLVTFRLLVIPPAQERSEDGRAILIA